MNERGASFSISIVILLLIAFSMAFFAWFWFTTIGSGIQNNGENGENQNLINNTKRVVIESAIGDKDSIILLRNMGEISVNISEITLFVDGQPEPCPGVREILPKNTVTCVITSYDCKDRKVRVSSPGGVDEKTCE